MNCLLIRKTRKGIYCFSLWIFSSLFTVVFAAGADQKQDFEHDSLLNEVRKYSSDTARFYVLTNYFWKYANKELYRVKTIGDLAFDEIKNSKNLKALSDGYDIKGFIFREEENFDSARFFFEKSLELSLRIAYKTRIAWSYYHLGELNYLLGDFNKALGEMKIALKYFRDLNDFNNTGSALYFISDMYDRMGISDSSIWYNNSKLALSASQSDTVGQIIAGLAISTYYKEHNDNKQSLEYLKVALREAESMNNSQALIKVYFSIGDFFAEQKKNYTIANEYYNRVLQFAEKKRYKTLEAQLLNKIGNVYLLEGNDSLALNYNLKSLKIAKDTKHRHTISNAYNSLGLVYKKLGDYTSAINCFRICYETGCNTCPVIKFHDALVELGNIYMLTGDKAESLVWYKKSLDLAEKFHSLDDISLSKFMIGDYYRKTGNTTLAGRSYSESFRLAEEAGNLLLTRRIADTMSLFFKSMNDYPSAYRYTKLSNVLADSLFEIDRRADITELEMKFEIEKIRKENEARQSVSAIEIKRQKTLRNFSVILSLVLFVSGFTVYAGYKRKKRDNKLLTYQKNQIEEKNEEIRTQVEEITSQKDEIQRISHELHESDEMKLRFFSNISHEFRTPLTLIMNPAEKLLNSIQDNTGAKKQLECIYNNAQKLLDLTNQIMDLQKLDAGKLQLNPVMADVIQFCLGIVSSFESSCYKKNLIIKFSSDWKSVVTYFDKDKLGKILVNIMANAIKFSFDDSFIYVRIRMPEDVFQLTITDMGVGIPSGEIDNVFRRYYQIPSEIQYSGTGIGLAYVKELVEFMKGNVSIKSGPNEGTKVIVSLPLRDSVKKDFSEFVIEIPDKDRHNESNGFDAADFILDEKYENTVLLVEDNDELGSFIAGLLKTEFNVRIAKNGKEGIQSAYYYVPDIIVSDVMMPGIDGFELCTTLKNDERTSHIPIILLTARDSAQSSLDGYRSGADDYIIKPFDNEHLKLKIRNIIATREAARSKFDFKSLLAPDGLCLGNTDKEFIRKCLAVIEKHIDNSSFSVEKLAEELAFSNRNFYRKIKAVTNQTPSELIRTFRLNYARQLLQNSKLKIFEISLAVGYEDVNKFRQAFKKQFGLSPSESVKSLIN